MFDMLREWWLIGEVFVYLVWDDKYGTFIDGEILPPEYIDIKGHPLVTGDVESSFDFYLIPDDTLVAFVQSTDETAERLKDRLPPEVIEAINTGQNIRINPFNLMVMMRKQSRYNPRGTSIILRCLKSLLYEDKILEAQYAIADRCILPMEIWKVGNEKVKPSQAKLKNIAELVRAMEDQPKRNIVTHYAVNYEVIGAVGKFPNLSSEFDWVEKRILTALFTNKAITTGEGPTYANASVAMRALLSRYIQVRSAIEQSWKTSIFSPIAIANKFYKTKPADVSGPAPIYRKPYKDRELLIPDFDWRHKTNLLDDNTYREQLLRLLDKNQIPMAIIAQTFGLDIDVIKDDLKKQEGTVLDPFYQLYREALIKKGISPDQAPAYPGTEEVPTGTEEVPTGASKRDLVPLFEKKDKKVEEKGDPKEKEETPKLKDLMFLAKGGVKRKTKAVELLFKQRKEKSSIGGKLNLAGVFKNNIATREQAPPEVRKLMKRKKVVVVTER
jgi:hypothetical protein